MTKKKEDIRIAAKKACRHQNEQDLTMTESKMVIGKVTFTFSLTEDEANAVLYKPKGQIARNLRKYMNGILQEAAKRFKENSDVKECKESEE